MNPVLVGVVVASSIELGFFEYVHSDIFVLKTKSKVEKNDLSNSVIYQTFKGE